MRPGRRAKERKQEKPFETIVQPPWLANDQKEAVKSYSIPELLTHSAFRLC